MKRANRQILRLLLCVLLMAAMLLSLAACTTETGTGGQTDTGSDVSSEQPATDTGSTDDGAESEQPDSGDTAAPTGSGGIGSNGLRQSSDGTLKIAYLLDSLSNDSSQRHWQQVQNECAARGWELIYDTNVSGNYEADATRQAFQNMMVQEPDAIVISYLDIPPIADLCVEAHNQGIGVYCIGTDISDGIMMNVCSNNSVIGAKVMF